jgi:hypothetical protein
MVPTRALFGIEPGIIESIGARHVPQLIVYGILTEHESTYALNQASYDRAHSKLGLQPLSS